MHGSKSWIQPISLHIPEVGSVWKKEPPGMEGQQYIQRHNYAWEREGVNIFFSSVFWKAVKAEDQKWLENIFFFFNTIVYQKEPELFGKIADFKVGIMKY